MLSGDNGILQKATDAKTLTKRSSVVEQARTDVLGYQAENKGGNLEKSQLKSVLDTYFKNVPEELPDGEELSNLELTTLDKYGTHQILVSEIYIGSLNNDVSTYSNDVKSKLSLNFSAESDDAISPYVLYRGKKYKVLYDDENNGIEIIAVESIGGEVTLGKNDETDGAQGTKGRFERAQWSYNNAIQTLNKSVEILFPNDGIIDDARCVGSVPGKTNGISNKNTSNDSLYVHGSNNTYFSAYDNQFKYGDITDAAYELADVYAMNDAKISFSIGVDYWFAYRVIDADRDCTYIQISSFNESFGRIVPKQIIDMERDEGNTCNPSPRDGVCELRPVLHLSSKVKITGGAGTSESPYILSK